MKRNFLLIYGWLFIAGLLLPIFFEQFLHGIRPDSLSKGLVFFQKAASFWESIPNLRHSCPHFAFLPVQTQAVPLHCGVSSRLCCMRFPSFWRPHSRSFLIDQTEKLSDSLSENLLPFLIAQPQWHTDFQVVILPFRYTAYFYIIPTSPCRKQYLWHIPFMIYYDRTSFVSFKCLTLTLRDTV